MQMTNGWIDVKDRLPPIADGTQGDWTEEVLVLIESPDSNTLWRDVYVGYQEIYEDDDGRETRTWFTYMDGDCCRVGITKFAHYPNGKRRQAKTGARVIAWQPLPGFPAEYPHIEFREGVTAPGMEMNENAVD